MNVLLRDICTCYILKLWDTWLRIYDTCGVCYTIIMISMLWSLKTSAGSRNICAENMDAEITDRSDKLGSSFGTSLWQHINNTHYLDKELCTAGLASGNWGRKHIVWNKSRNYSADGKSSFWIMSFL